MSPPGPTQPLPPWLQDGRRKRAPGGGSLRGLRASGLVVAGAAVGWFLHGWREAPPAAPPNLPVAQAVCPASHPCTVEPTPIGVAHPLRPHPHAAARTLTLHPLPAEAGPVEENRREALRAFAQTKAGDLRGCLTDPGRGPLRRVGAALEIDAHGSVAAVQILGGDNGSREVETCYSTHLRAWRFPQALLQGDERLLVNFVL